MAFALRDLDPAVLQRLDQAAAAKGMSRNRYIIEVLTEHAGTVRPAATEEVFSAAAELASDLGDDDLMRRAWS